MSRSTDSIVNPPIRELTTPSNLSPFWGSFKRFLPKVPAKSEITAQPAVAIYAAVLVAAATVCAVALVATGASPGQPWVVLGLAAVAALAERRTVRISSRVEMSVALFPTLFAAVVFGPLASLIVFAASMASDFRRPYLKWLVYTASRSITGAAAGGIAAVFASGETNTFSAVAFATIAAGLTTEVLDVAFVSLTIRFRGAGTFVDGLKTVGPVVASALPLQAPVVALLAYAFESVSVWTLPLFLGPAFAAQRLFVLYHEQRKLAADLMIANDRLERANLSFATALVATLDARDRYTAGHSAAVAVYARDIAKRMGLSEGDQELAHLAGLVHDIGKIGLPPGLLEKEGALTLHERRQMEEHAVIGERILANVDDYSDVAQVVRHHHERYDGNGYPDGLAGAEIPPLSRILAVADAYDAMISDRPYRDAMPSRVARLRLAQAADSQFDTSVVAAFEAILAGASEEYRSGSDRMRMPELNSHVAAL
jgi:putative nucleotidyltransferase with HDIG domain